MFGSFRLPVVSGYVYLTVLSLMAVATDTDFTAGDSGAVIFTARAYARAVLGVVILFVRLPIRLSRVDCDKTE